MGRAGSGRRSRWPQRGGRLWRRDFDELEAVFAVDGLVDRFESQGVWVVDSSHVCGCDESERPHEEHGALVYLVVDHPGYLVGEQGGDRQLQIAGQGQGAQR